MDLPVAIVFGALFGLMGCVAPAALYERVLRGGSVSLAAGIAAVGMSLLTLTAVLLVVYTATNAGFLEFGCAMVGSFLLFWAVEAVRGWRAANGRA
ncbi:hypothetical protein B5F79_08720 [Olsenella sp. An285]|uniref:hypothetical protein n=1 Tax=Olsenella sp. An285 TaxID=1965621 RepID=UPI000B3A4F36|nr:hypothetical protein [Olsenella sp. An285]OUO45822.1 hypothetical protein B5F79_08720 [Olsenella sp. An285]